MWIFHRIFWYLATLISCYIYPLGSRLAFRLFACYVALYAVYCVTIRIFYLLRPYGLVNTDDPYLYIVYCFNYIMSICCVCSFCSICPYPHARLICLICQFALIASICRYVNMYHHNFCPKKRPKIFSGNFLPFLSFCRKFAVLPLSDQRFLCV